MKKLNLIFASLWMTASTFALGGNEGGGSGGPPARATETLNVNPSNPLAQDVPAFEMDPVTGILRVNPRVPEIKISHDDMQRAIEAARLKRYIPFETEQAEIVNIRAEVLDFKNKRLHGRLLESGDKIILKEVQESLIEREALMH